MGLRSDWRFGEKITAEELEHALPKHFAIRPGQLTREHLTVLDDFNWRIWQSGRVLTRNARSNRLRLWDENRDLADCSAGAEDRFWWQLPTGELADALKQLLAVRAFVPKYTTLLTTEHWNIVNSDDKIVARIKLFGLGGDTGPDVSLMTILPLKGFSREYDRIVKSFSQLQPRNVDALTLRRLLLESGMRVTIPVTEPDFNLAPAEPAETAVTRMAERMLLSARLFEQGIIDDIDTEFVHQYRVHIRKTRSLLDLFKKALTAQRYQLLKTELKTLGGRTNELRDLDVFLLDRENYQNMLPDNLRPGLNGIFNRISRRRTIALKKVAETLASDEYQARVGLLLQTLQQPVEQTTTQARTGIKPLICRKVLTQYRKIRIKGGKIHAGTPDEAIHDLRIEAKKLRYLLELFSALFPEKKHKRLVKLLKKLQDNLGYFNDYSVQREFILKICQGRHISAEQLASMNGLAAVLYNKQDHERSMVVKNIAGFTGEPVNEQFIKLFNSDFQEGPAE